QGRLLLESPLVFLQPRCDRLPRHRLRHWHLILKVTTESPTTFSSRPGKAPAVTEVDRLPGSMSAQLPTVPSVDPDKLSPSTLFKSWIVEAACPVPMRRLKCWSPAVPSNGASSDGQGFGLQEVVVVMRRRICRSLRCVPPAGNVPLAVTWIGLLHTPV